ncbi:MAG: ATP-dependent RecD-like DNA helicase [Anaerolineae bacterium]|jgi:exodeoxyribonuclease V alpha subunit|nr:ATP-dependent RecD-like DNA helicase [Anaerolineae bacterium]
MFATPMPDAATTPLQTLEGTLERVTFQNEENGYTVAKVVPRGKAYEVTVIGTLTGVNVGESLRLRGVWTEHPRYGKQFQVRDYVVQLPATLEGLRKYLGSGLIRGIGPVNAGRIVDVFGLQTLDVIEHNVNRLREVPGIGEKRAASVAVAWEEQKQIKEIMLFLQSHGVSTGLAVKIFKQYGDEAIAIVQENPYRLAKDIWGIGFKTADKVARQMGVAHDAPQRIEAGLRYVLGTFSDEGHCFATRLQLLDAATQILEVPTTGCEPALEGLLQQEELIAEDEAIYLPPFFRAEASVAAKLRLLLRSPRDRLETFTALDWDRAFTGLDARNDFKLAEAQRRAVRMALTHKVAILTGGPGTGKTTITRAIIQLLQSKGCSVLLAAPTGRAAKRLSELTGLEAKTLHRLLEYKPAQGNRFLRDSENPLDTDLIIVDEASMIDILLINHLLQAVEAGSHLLLVGDGDQLPSVGPGNVLQDLIASTVIPVTRLETIFRQADDSFIIVNAHRINHGELPLFPPEARDFFLFHQEDPEQATELVLDIVARRIPAKFGLDARRDVQVLSPMHRGPAGVSALNRRLQEVLNPPAADKTQITHGSRILRTGDRVMQIHNDYERQVFNGDMGYIIAIDLEDQTVTIAFDDTTALYEFSELDAIVHAYAVSIHKAQGSEFPAVVLPLLTQHYMMLQRNLLYTGVTRARSLVVLVGGVRAIAIAVRNDKIAQRNTRLAQRLQVLGR